MVKTNFFSKVVCPACHAASLTARVQETNDGLAELVGTCPGCGYVTFDLDAVCDAVFAASHVE